DGPTGRDGVDAHTPELPRHRQLAVLGPGVGHQARPGVDDQTTHLVGRSCWRAVRRTGAADGPGLVARLLGGPDRPLAHPATGTTQRRRNFFGTLAGLATPHRFFAQLLFGHLGSSLAWSNGAKPTERCPAVTSPHQPERCPVFDGPAGPERCPAVCDGTMSCGPSPRPKLPALR